MSVVDTQSVEKFVTRACSARHVVVLLLNRYIAHTTGPEQTHVRTARARQSEVNNTVA